MKFTSLFFKASAVYLRVYLKDNNKRARNMKFTSLFFKNTKNNHNNNIIEKRFQPS